MGPLYSRITTSSSYHSNESVVSEEETPEDFNRARREVLDPTLLTETMFPPAFHPLLRSLRTGERIVVESLRQLEELRGEADRYHVPGERVFQLRAHLLLNLTATDQEMSRLFASAIDPAK